MLLDVFLSKVTQLSLWVCNVCRYTDQAKNSIKLASVVLSWWALDTFAIPKCTIKFTSICSSSEYHEHFLNHGKKKKKEEEDEEEDEEEEEEKEEKKEKKKKEEKKEKEEEEKEEEEKKKTKSIESLKKGGKNRMPECIMGGS